MYVESANLCGFRLQFADSAYNLQNPLTICGFHLQFAVSTYNLRIPGQRNFTKHIYDYLLGDSTN